jgi:hypothetical protein
MHFTNTIMLLKFSPIRNLTKFYPIKRSYLATTPGTVHWLKSFLPLVALANVLELGISAKGYANCVKLKR